MAERPLRAAVIGSGFGGLAAALRLRAAGLDTVLFEARDRPGGRAAVFRDQGFTFDAGPTVITAPSCVEELFAACGRRLADYVELLPVRPFYRLLWPDGDRLDYDGDAGALVAEISRRAPADVDGYAAFFEYSRRLYEAGYQRLAATPFLHLRDMLRVVPTLARLRADRPVYHSVARRVRDDRLRQALSFHALLVGGNPFETSSIYALIHYLERREGVFFPRGGTGALIAALVRLFGELGGTLRLATPVRRVLVRGDARAPTHLVHTDGAPPEPFDIVVSNADVHHTYAVLYADDPRAAPMRRRLERARWSMSLVVVYFGTDRTYPECAHHTVLFGPRYAGLLRDIFHGTALPDDFSLYLHAPTVTDPSLAPPGCATFYVLSPVPNLRQAPLDWAVEGPRYAERILAALERVLPDLRRHVVVRHIYTPADFARNLHARHGAAFSLAPTLRQSAWFRPHNRDPRIPGLYLVGAGTHPGAGVPGVVNSARATAGLVLRDCAGRRARAPMPGDAAETAMASAAGAPIAGPCGTAP